MQKLILLFLCLGASAIQAAPLRLTLQTEKGSATGYYVAGYDTPAGLYGAIKLKRRFWHLTTRIRIASAHFDGVKRTLERLMSDDNYFAAPIGAATYAVGSFNGQLTLVSSNGDLEEIRMGLHYSIPVGSSSGVYLPASTTLKVPLISDESLVNTWVTAPAYGKESSPYFAVDPQAAEGANRLRPVTIEAFREGEATLSFVGENRTLTLPILALRTLPPEAITTYRAFKSLEGRVPGSMLELLEKARLTFPELSVTGVQSLVAASNAVPELLDQVLPPSLSRELQSGAAENALALFSKMKKEGVSSGVCLDLLRGGLDLLGHLKKNP